METNPRLTFTDFWGHLSRLYDRDSQAQLRLQWESVKIAPGELNLDKWLQFLRESQLKRDRVEDRSHQEEYKLLMKNLPKEWQKWVLVEEEKLGKNKFLVSISNLPSRPPRIIQHHVEIANNTHLSDCQLVNNGVLVTCDTLADQKKSWDSMGVPLKATVLRQLGCIQQ